MLPKCLTGIDWVTRIIKFDIECKHALCYYKIWFISIAGTSAYKTQANSSNEKKNYLLISGGIHCIPEVLSPHKLCITAEHLQHDGNSSHLQSFVQSFEVDLVVQLDTLKRLPIRLPGNIHSRVE